MELKLAEAGEFFRKNQHAARIAGVTALVLAMSAWTSCSARTIAKEARAGIAEAVTIRETATRFEQQFIGATTGETDEWARTTESAAEFGTPEALKLSLAQQVSRIAEVAGLSGVIASFTPADSVGLAQPRSLGDLTFAPAPYGIRLEGSGSGAAVSRVVLRLPRSTEIMSVTLAGNIDALKATFQLAVYHSEGGPQN